MYALHYYGNGPVMAKVITAVAYVLNSSSYGTLLQAIMILAGLLMLVGWHSDNVRGGAGAHRLGVSMLILATLYYGGYSPKTDVTIYDPLNNFTTSVRHVPQGAAMVMWISNQITRGFAELFDAGFTSSGFPDEFTYEHSGGTPSAILTVSSLGRITPNDAYLFMTIENYIKNCYMSAVLLGLKNINNIRDSANLLDEISTNLSDSWNGTYYSADHPRGVNESCSQLYTDMKNDLQHAVGIGGSVSKQLYLFLKSLGVPAVLSDSDAQNILQAAGDYMLAGSASSQSMLAQAVLINALNPEMLAFAEQSGFNPAAFNMAITQSALNTTAQMSTSYALASTFLPLSFLVANSFIIAILPLTLALMFAPTLTRKYGLLTFDLLMWLAFWGPVASVINFIVQSYAASTTGSVLGGHITYSTFPFLMAHMHTLMAITGDIMFSVPVLAFALASGSTYAMTTATGAVAGLSKAAAAGASSRMTTATGIRSEKNAAQENVAEGQAVSDTGHDNRDLTAGLLDVEYGSARHTAAQMEAYRNFMKQIRAKTYGEVKGDYMAAETRAEQENLYQMDGTGGIEKAIAGNLANTLGRGVGYGSIAAAAEVGRLQTQQKMAEVLGAWQSYQNARKHGYTGSFVQYLEQSSLYRTTSAVAEAEQMQRMADRYFGGDLKREMDFLEFIRANRMIGDARAFDQAYSAARSIFNFQGDRAAFQQYLEETHLESLFGQNRAIDYLGRKTGLGVAGVTFVQRLGGNEKAYVEGAAYEQVYDDVPFYKLVSAAVNREMYGVGRNLGTAPTPEEAEKRGEWEEKKKYTDYTLTEWFMKSPEAQALWESARRFSDTILGRQIPQALLMKPDDIRFKSVEKSTADYLKTFREPGAFNEAADVTDAEMRYLSAAVSKDIKHGKEGMMMTQLDGQLKGSLVAGFKLLGSGAQVKVGGGIRAVDQVADELSRATGIEITSDILRTQLMKKIWK